MRVTRVLGSLAPVAMLLAAPVVAAEDADELARKLSNPVAALVSVPLQYNLDVAIGPEDGTRQTLNIQPVVPMALGDDWNLITRVILPVVAQDDVFGSSGSQFGLGDTTPTFFFSPKEPTAGGLLWGAGPVFLLPTATDELLGGGKWGAGPSLLALVQRGHLTYGVLANQIWSVAGDDDRDDLSNAFLQPFLARGFAGGWTLTGNFEASYNWKSSAWTVPFHFIVSRVTTVGARPVSFAGGVRYFVETPGEGPDWGLRAVVTLLFPQ